MVKIYVSGNIRMLNNVFHCLTDEQNKDNIRNNFFLCHSKEPVDFASSFILFVSD